MENYSPAKKAGKRALPDCDVVREHGENTMLPNKDLTRDPKAGKPAVWKTGKTG
mgnify:CR=1 FL=1|jgi:hypothetical protein